MRCRVGGGGGRGVEAQWRRAWRVCWLSWLSQSQLLCIGLDTGHNLFPFSKMSHKINCILRNFTSQTNLCLYYVPMDFRKIVRKWGRAVDTWYLYSYFLNRKKVLAYGILIFNQHQEKYGIIFSKSLLSVVTEIGQRALVLAETINNNKKYLAFVRHSII